MKGKPKYRIDNAKLTRLVEKAQKGDKKATEEVVNQISGYIYYYSFTVSKKQTAAGCANYESRYSTGATNHSLDILRKL